MKIADVMTTPGATIELDDSLATVKDIFDSLRLRHLKLWVICLAGVLAGCSRSPAPRVRADEPTLIHTPPMKQLDLRQLKALSIECEKYLPGQFARGPYDAAYCQAAIDAWGDAPLQMVRIPASPRAN